MRSVLVVLAAFAAFMAAGPATAGNSRERPAIDKPIVRVDAATQSRSDAKVYVVQMRADPAISYAGGVTGFAKTAPAAGAKYDSRSSQVQMYTAHLAAQQDALLGRVGAGNRKLYSYRHAMNGFAALLTGAEVARLRKDKSVMQVWEDRRMPLDTNNSPKFLGITNPSNGLRAKHGFRGQGIKIAVIDSGIVQEHPSFADNGLPPPQNWNGSCQEGEGFPANSCNNKLIGAQFFVEGFGAENVIPTDFLSPRDADGHGSHTASTAAGNEVVASFLGTPLAPISGMAPDAHIAAYKACFKDATPNPASCAFSDTMAATDTAVADGADVISYSIGTAASFTDPTDIAFLFAADAGLFIARSAGNAGPGPGSTNAGEPWVTTVAASTLKGTGFALAARVNSPSTIDGNYPALEGAITKPLVDSGPITRDVVAANPLDACAPIAPVTDKIVLITRGTCTFVAKVEAAVNAGAAAVLMYTNILPNGVENPKVVMGVDPTALTSMIPGVMTDNAPGVAILGALNSGATVNVTLAPDVFVKELIGPGRVMAGFSSRGPFLTESSWIKPDITAPGVQILAAHTPDPHTGMGGDFFQYLQGTSMSTPHIAGLGALIRQAHPDWSPAAIKSALMTTAHQNVVKEDTVTRADPFDFGAGHVNANKARDPGLIYDALLFDYFAASCGTVSPIVTPGSCDLLADVFGFSLHPADLNLPSIGIDGVPGKQTIRRSVTNVALSDSTYTAQTQPPPGFKMKVKPDTLHLGRGETKSFEVVFENVSAPPGEWRFGWLNWKDNKHSVRSPVAVNAVALVAPDEITGESPDGATSFGVTFGYNGTYDANVHGLENPFHTPAFVNDDPDNTFDFFGEGEIDPYFLEVEPGTVYAQWSTFDVYTDGNHDLDLFLFYCPLNDAGTTFECSLVDASLGPTAEERVSVDFPLNDPANLDPYLLLVHGFETENGEPAGFVLFDWTFPGPGPDRGNMTATGPATAVIGQDGTVDVTWTGLATGPGAKQAGAISHNDATGIKGRTVVNIKNDGTAGYADLCAILDGGCPAPAPPTP